MTDHDYSKYWNTKRIVNIPQTTEEWGQVWEAIGAIFRPRSGEREGCIYTNHQGFVAVQATLAMSAGKPLADPTLTDGLTLDWPWAFDVMEKLQREAISWPGKAQSKLQELSDVLAEALTDGMMKKKHAVAVVDTSSSLFGRWPALWYEKYKRRHEAAHVWQYTLNHRHLGLISKEKMLADPEYPVIAKKLEDYYQKMTPDDVYSETTAFLIAGQGVHVGLPTKKRANGFLERFFRGVKLEYGQEALDMLQIVHPRVRKILDYVRSESVERDVGREEERTSGNAVERRDDGTEDKVKIRKGIILTEMGGLHSERRLGEKIPIETAFKGARALALTSALEKIAAIDPSNPGDTRSWRELGASAVAIAREAVAGFERTEDGAVSSVLQRIAEMGPVNGPGARRSWKDVTMTAVETARTALEAVSQGANAGMNVRAAAAEAARDAHSNERSPAQCISW